MRVISAFEDRTSRKAVTELLGTQPGDVQATFTDMADRDDAVGFRVRTPADDGLARFFAW
jgi:hypothetical protein